MLTPLNRRTLLASSLVAASGLALPRMAFAQAVGTRNVLFVLLRVAYIYLYVTDRASLRSLAWMAALLVNVVILFLGFR